VRLKSGQTFFATTFAERATLVAKNAQLILRHPTALDYSAVI
jgi:hypothetical protein